MIKINSIVKPRRIRPIYMMNARCVSDDEKEAALSGITAVLKVADTNLEIKDFSYWNQGNKNYESVDWYIKSSKTNRDCGYGQQLDASRILDLFSFEPWQTQQSHYDIFIVDHDLYSPGTNFVIGSAGFGQGTVFSVKRFRDLNPRTKYECIKSETMHELGHVFEAAIGRRGTDVLTGIDNGSDLYNNHCANQCTMQQGNAVPTAWIKLSNNRLSANRAFCKQCEDDIREYFKYSP